MTDERQAFIVFDAERRAVFRNMLDLSRVRLLHPGEQVFGEVFSCISVLKEEWPRADPKELAWLESLEVTFEPGLQRKVFVF